MRNLATLGLAALLYGVTAWAVNPAFAGDMTADDVTAIKDARTGDMTKLVVHDAPKSRVEDAFADIDGKKMTLSDFGGKVIVLNFWATWCPPCRAEMPSIDRLSADMAGQDVTVLALSTDRGSIARVRSFFKDVGIKNLPVIQDKRSRVARSSAVIGLPVTLILDREGREIARLQGEAEWDSDAVKTILGQIINRTAPEG